MQILLTKNDVTYTCCINLAEAIIRHRKLLLTCRELPTVVLSHHVKIRELLTSRVVFAVNMYEFLTENKNMIRTFSGCKPSKKNNIETHQSFTGCYKKHGDSGLTPIHAEYQK